MSHWGHRCRAWVSTSSSEPGLEVGSRVGGEGVGKGDCRAGLRHDGWVGGWMDGWMDGWMETELITTADPKLIRPDNAMRTNVVIRL